MDVTKYAESQYLNMDLLMESPSKEITFLSAGEEVKGNYGYKLEFRVSIDGKEKTYSPNMQSIKNLKEAWGKESSNWLMKTAILTTNYDEKKKQTLVIAKPKIVEEEQV